MKNENLLKKYTLLVVMLSSFLTPFMGSAINLAIPSIGRALNTSTNTLSWVVSSYLLSTVAFLLPLGRLADIVGRKKVFILGISLFAIASILCGLSWSGQVLIFFRILQGMGSAMIFGTGMAILTSVFPPQERGKVLGINVATVYLGLSLGPVLGGVINQNLGWQYIFFFSALIAFLAFVFALLNLKGEWAYSQGEKFDLIGCILYIVGLVSFMGGISSIATNHWAKYLLLLGIVFLLAFVKWEKNIKQPIINLSLFTNNVTFAFSNLSALINYSATFAVSFLLSLYLQVVMGYNSQLSGMILLSQPIIMAILSPFAGKLSDKVEPRLVASYGMTITTIGLFIFAFLNEKTPISFVMLNLALLGFGFALFSSPNNNAVMGSVEKRFYGIASSTLGTMRLTGQAISMAIVTLILDLYVGNKKLSEADFSLIIQGSNTAFLVFAVICFFGIFASLSRGKINKSKQNES